MGDIADMMLEGILCEGCGDLIDETGSGYPRRCKSCGPIKQLQDALKRSMVSGNAHKAERHNRERRDAARVRKPFACGQCQKLFRSERGVEQHKRDVHEAAERSN